MAKTEEQRGLYIRVAFFMLVFLLMSLARALPAVKELPSPFPLLLYQLNYLLPALLALRETKRLGIRQGQSPAGLLRGLLLLPVLLALLSLISVLTVLLFPSVGQAGGIAGEPLDRAITLHCLLPATLEEMFFRMTLLPLLLRADRRTAVPLNALLFALIHAPQQMPYAFCGGVMLCLAAEIGGPLAPWILHFANNLASLLLMWGEAWWGLPFTLAALAVLLLCGALAVLLLIRQRRASAYEPLVYFFSRKDGMGDAVRAALPLLPICLLSLLLALL